MVNEFFSTTIEHAFHALMPKHKHYSEFKGRRMPRVLYALLILVLCVYVTGAGAQLQVEVDIKGVGSDLLKNVQLFLSIEQQKRHALLTEGRIRRLHKKANAEIKKALQPFGYYRPTIEAVLQREGRERWRAVYTIDHGPPLPIAKLEYQLTGAAIDDPEFKAWVARLPLREGEVLNQAVYEKAKDDLANLAAQRGYFEARFVTHRIEINLDAYNATIRLHFDSGPRYRFGAVSFKQDILDSELLHRYLPFTRGEPYTIDRLMELQQALNDSDYFQDVEVSAQREGAIGTEVPIGVRLTPRKRYRYTFGIGYGTDTGARGKIGWEMPRLNSRGHRFDSELKLSEIRNSLTANYRIPVRNPRTDQLVYSVGLISEATDTSESDIHTLSANLIHARGAWRETLSLTFQEERFTVASDQGSSRLLMPGVSWTRIWSKNRISTRKGLRLTIDLRGASQQLVSDSDFVQGQVRVKGIVPFGRRGRLVGRVAGGATWTPTIYDLPPSVRFFAGGAQSVRGYAYQSLGPTNESGEIVGSRNLLVGGLEYEYSFAERWGAALFYDVGNAIDNFTDPLKHGAGFGLRWKSPVGPVLIDLASALDRDGHPWRIHINIGPDL